MLLIFSNTCTETKFTYQIDGPNAIYLGVGDHHNKKYNSMVVTNSIIELVDRTSNAKDSSFTGLPLDNDSCTFSFHVYPSETLENRKFGSTFLCMGCKLSNITCSFLLSRIQNKQWNHICSYSCIIDNFTMFDYCIVRSNGNKATSKNRFYGNTI